MRSLIALLTPVCLLFPGTSAFALPVIQIASSTHNDNGTRTFGLEISTLPEVSFLDLTIMAHDGQLNQVDGGVTYDAVSSSPWAPSVVFTSDAPLAGALNPSYAANAGLDTVIDDTYWPGKVAVELDPPAGPGQGSMAGTTSVHVVLTSFTGGVGGPLPGGYIPLAQITASGCIWVSGTLQSASDQQGSFEALIPLCPEPSTALFAIMGASAIVVSAGRRRRLHGFIAMRTGPPPSVAPHDAGHLSRRP